MYIATIDSGTTNTRVAIWQGNNIVARASAAVGVRDTALTGSREKLAQGVREALDKASAALGIKVAELACLLASGMITSNLGLKEVPHLQAPAGLEELAQGMVGAVIPEVAPQKIWFVPGVKNPISEVNLENCEAMDMMRGEEVEAIGILQALNLRGPLLVILPGSHTKFLLVDEKNRISSCVTTLGGEVIWALAKETILAHTFQDVFSDELAEEMLLKGARYAQEVGLNRVLFSIRILDLFTPYSREEKVNFFRGAVFGTDLLALKNSKALGKVVDLPIVIAGKPLFKNTFRILVQEDPELTGQVHILDDELGTDLAGRGALLVARARGLVK